MAAAAPAGHGAWWMANVIGRQCMR
eukprot:SAG22_NODE_14263_length_380_cov_0.644128_1_plen_24_part_10